MRKAAQAQLCITLANHGVGRKSLLLLNLKPRLHPDRHSHLAGLAEARTGLPEHGSRESMLRGLSLADRRVARIGEVCLAAVGRLLRVSRNSLKEAAPQKRMTRRHRVGGSTVGTINYCA